MGQPLVGTLSSWFGAAGINGSLAYTVRIRLGVKLDPKTQQHRYGPVSLQLSMLLSFELTSSSGLMSDPIAHY